jgi:CRP-like cAMP-binding protein
MGHQADQGMNSSQSTRDLPVLPVILQKASQYRARQSRTLDHLSIPSLKSKILSKDRVREEFLQKKRAKAAVKTARRQRKKKAREKKRQIQRDKELEELAYIQRSHEAAAMIQRMVRRVIGWGNLIRVLRSLGATVKLQAMVRGYNICRQMQKVVSMRERMKEKKLLILQASVCILRAFQKWVKRSRARRWVYMLREVRAALQGDERSESMLNASAVSFSNGIRVSRDKLGAGKMVGKTRPHQVRKGRRGSTMSALAGVHVGSTIQGRGNVQRLSIVESDQDNTIEIQTMQLKSGNLTTVHVGHIMWAHMGKGKLEEIEEHEHEAIHRTLLDYCLMQTGQNMTPIALFAQIPALCDMFQGFGEVTFKTTPSKDWHMKSDEGHREEVRLPKTLREMFSERLSMKFVPQGKVIYEQGRKGKQMYFLHSGKVEFLTWNTQAGVEPEKVGEISEMATDTARMLKAQAVHLTDVKATAEETDPIFSFAGHRRKSVDHMQLDRFNVAASVGEGGFFGTLSLVQGRQGSLRLSTAVAVKDTHLFSIHVKDLEAMAEQAESEELFWRTFEGIVISWVKNAEEDKTMMTPDLKVLSRLQKARIERIRTVMNSRVCKNMDHKVAPIDKFKRSVRVAMCSARWKRLAGVKLDLHPPEDVSLYCAYFLLLCS